jgi:hypothetical protein
LSPCSITSLCTTITITSNPSPFQNHQLVFSKPAKPTHCKSAEALQAQPVALPIHSVLPASSITTKPHGLNSPYLFTDTTSAAHSQITSTHHGQNHNLHRSSAKTCINQLTITPSNQKFNQAKSPLHHKPTSRLQP